MRSSHSFLIAMVGPTGSGKSALALRLARSIPSEIVSCDALQVYRGADIGTGKLSFSGRRGIPHHLLDVACPSQEFSAADYIRLAAPIIEDIDGRGKLPLLVGGTGLYLRALLRGLFEGPGRDATLRHRISDIAGRRGLRFVHRMLARLDAASAERIHPNDLIRTVRALEVCLLAKRPMSDLMKDRRSPLAGYSRLLFGLAPTRAELARRVEVRLRQMFDSGVIGEVQRLLSKYGPQAPVLKAIGYRQVAQLLAGEMDVEQAKQSTLRATLQYAKRQMTWFRREEGVVWFPGSGDDPKVGEAIESYLGARPAPRSPMEFFQLRKEEGVHAKTAS